MTNKIIKANDLNFMCVCVMSRCLLWTCQCYEKPKHHTKYLEPDNIVNNAQHQLYCVSKRNQRTSNN